MQIIDKYLDKWNWEKLSCNLHITQNIIDKYIKKWRWLCLSFNCNLDIICNSKQLYYLYFLDRHHP
jgi:hypothetical protein